MCSSEELDVDSAKIKPRKVLAELLQQTYLLTNRITFWSGSNSSAKPTGETKRLRYDIIDQFDEATNLSAMMRTTAFPASIIAQMMAKGDVIARGAAPQRNAIDAEKFVSELEKKLSEFKKAGCESCIKTKSPEIYSGNLGYSK